MEHTDLAAHLARQLEFLKRSSATFDEGYQDEAIRIAQTLRVLLHDAQSQSLLTQLNAKNVLLLSTCPEAPPYYFRLAGGLSYSKVVLKNGNFDQSKPYPKLGGSQHDHSFLEREEWWNQVIYRFPGSTLTRRDIVLNVAHREGGAHIDPKLKDVHKAVKAGIAVILDCGEARIEKHIEDPHYADLRQMAFELLNSPNLLELAQLHT